VLGGETGTAGPFGAVAPKAMPQEIHASRLPSAASSRTGPPANTPSTFSGERYAAVPATQAAATICPPYGFEAETMVRTRPTGVTVLTSPVEIASPLGSIAPSA
jgi:hypothetical protein